MTSSSRLSSVKSQNTAFVPSPRWLSESPAKPPGPGTSISDRSPHHQTPSFAPNLKSPIPPPPANLYPGSPAAFNVDPGIPFLATVGPTEASSSTDASNKDWGSPQKGFGGALMSGIKHVVRRSLRDRTRSQQQPPNPAIYIQPPEFRDSGFAESVPTPGPPLPNSNLAPPPIPESGGGSSPSSRLTVLSARPPSETLLGHQDDGDEATMIGHQNSFSMGKPVRKPSHHGSRRRQYSPVRNDIPQTPPYDERLRQRLPRIYTDTVQPGPEMPAHDERQRPQPYPDIVPPEAIASPVSAELRFGDNYVQMRIKTPPPSETSLNTYVKRFQKIVHDVNALPWISKDRVTADYYPEKSRRSDEPKHHPAIVWRSEAFTKPSSDPKPASDHNSDPSVEGSSPGGLRAPRRGSYTAMDLGAEFEGNRAPLPINPLEGSIPQQVIPPDRAAPPDSMLLQPGPPPPLPPPPVFAMPTSVHVTYENYPPDPPPPPPQVPQFYIPPSWELAAPRPPSVSEPSFVRPSLPEHVPPVVSQTHTPFFSIPPISTNAPSVASPPPFNILPTSPNARYSPPVDPAFASAWGPTYIPNSPPIETPPFVPSGFVPFTPSPPASPPPDKTPVFPRSAPYSTPSESSTPTPVAGPSTPNFLYNSPPAERTPVFPPYSSPQVRSPVIPPHPTTTFYSPPRQTPPVIPGSVANKRPATPWVSSPVPSSESDESPPAPESPPFVPDRDRDGWEPYPQERAGYVPYQFSEHYYGNQYGEGIHAARPPLVQPPLSDSS